MTITFDIWMLAGGALAGLAAVALAKGRNRLVKGAVLGAITVFLFDLARSFL